MSGTTDTGHRGSAEIEHEVEATRAGLTQTLEELRERASPGQLFEQALDYARTSGGAEFTRNLGTAVRDNPLPLLLIGAGIGWLMLGKAPSTAPRRNGAYAPPLSPAYPGQDDYRHGDYRHEDSGPGLLSQAAEAVGDAAGAVRDGVTGAARSAADAAGSAYRSVAGAVGSAGESVGQAARDMRGRSGQAAHVASGYAGPMRNGAADYADRASGYADAAQHRMGEWADEAQHSMGALLRDQPLVLGALGVALGAAVGAMLPRTETEDRLMGETRDDLAQQAAGMAQQGYERARDSIGGHAEQARGTASEGLSTLAGQAREAVVGAAHNLAEQAKEALAEKPDAEPAKPGTGPQTGPQTGAQTGARPSGLG
ncbi:DUF3618 domain-containing protein [Falsiroseomonas tokyonensis]|uniref:DUF3618 domain-containing protein n=1 Tax=Falsiroseomonas tokyonensis TaxID=430521 RepID=A0ABV7BZ30_9PROT|nr:DUF3618 domain-containing protein [Falsiroseomonas tokyonensis]MBU8539312.1 DUF3618 domain-containing protein [Falsiroseomonas tokyonensis]